MSTGWAITFWLYVAIAMILAIAAIIMGCVTISGGKYYVKGKKHYGRDKARAGLQWCFLGPLLAPLWLPGGLALGGIWLTLQTRRVVRDAEIVEGWGEFHDKRTKYKELESQNARLQAELEEVALRKKKS